MKQRYRYRKRYEVRVSSLANIIFDTPPTVVGRYHWKWLAEIFCLPAPGVMMAGHYYIVEVWI